ncbi:MAG: hypothetical protein HUU55_22165 [Myxococcales bacterium]|nr:hypothetical protein [Myxococcales bacterium]
MEINSCCSVWAALFLVGVLGTWGCVPDVAPFQAGSDTNTTADNPDIVNSIAPAPDTADTGAEIFDINGEADDIQQPTPGIWNFSSWNSATWN